MLPHTRRGMRVVGGQRGVDPAGAGRPLPVTDEARDDDHVSGDRVTDDDLTVPDGPDVVDLLTADHREITARVAEVRDSPPDERRDRTDGLITELVRHLVAEETWLHPAITERVPDSEEPVARDREDHRRIEEQLKRLESLDPADPDFAESLARLESLFTDHAAVEEAERFPALRERIGWELRVELAERVRDAKRTAPTRPHPDSPDSALYHRLVGPGVGLVDRLRDRFGGGSSGAS